MWPVGRIWPITSAKDTLVSYAMHLPSSTPNAHPPTYRQIALETMEHNITAADGPVRSPRKRTAVPTYNLKVLNGTSRHARKDYRQKQRMSEPRVMASMEQNSDNVVISGLPTNIRRSTTGSLTSPMESPQLNALEISLRDVDATPLDGHAANTLHGAQQIGRSRDSMMPRQDAANFFNIHSSPRGHYYSAPVLYACGVWVGYL